MLQKRKKIKKVSILLTFLVAIITIVYGMYKLKVEKNIYQDNTKVLDTISQILDLNTVKYNYSNIVTVKKDKSINGVKIPLTEKSFIIKYNGVINGGIKPEDIVITKNTGNEIYIDIKNCRILDHYVDSDKIYIYDIKNSIFNRLEIQEVLNDIDKYKKEYEEKIIKEGFMEEVKKNTKISLEEMLKNMGYKDVVIVFK